MTCFVSGSLPPEDSFRLPWAGCLHCRREDCPLEQELALRRAACLGFASARLLTAKADRLLEAVSAAGDVRALLDADEDMERALAQALRSETALYDRLCAQAAKRGT